MNNMIKKISLILTVVFIASACVKNKPRVKIDPKDGTQGPIGQISGPETGRTTPVTPAIPNGATEFTVNYLHDFGHNIEVVGTEAADWDSSRIHRVVKTPTSRVNGLKFHTKGIDTPVN